MDPFGNYLIQKLLDRCSEEQRLQVRAGGRCKGQGTLATCSPQCVGVQNKQNVQMWFARLAVMPINSAPALALHMPLCRTHNLKCRPECFH